MATLEVRAKQLIRDIRRSCNDCRATNGGVCDKHWHTYCNLTLNPVKYVPIIENELSGKASP